MPKINHSQSAAQKRRLRVRAKLSGTSDRPRVSVHRTNKHTFLQAIDDGVGKTIASVHDAQLKGGQTKTERAVASAQQLAQQLQQQGIKAAIFDRGSRRYHGRVRAVAEALRSAGVEV